MKSLQRSRQTDERRREAPLATSPSPQLALLNLQRTAGNAAVTGLLARYEAGEHAQMGDENPTIKFQGVDVSQGELIALGDFYASSEDMLNADPTELAEIVKLIRQDKQAYEGVPGVKPVTTEEWKKALENRPEGKRYLDLLADNQGHFAPPSAGEDFKGEFFVNHRNALKIAHGAASGSKTVPVEAQVMNGWAGHYLTDAFSAGHLFNKNQMLERIAAAWNSIDEAWGADTENTFTRGVAAAVFADPAAVAKLAAHELWTPVAWVDITEFRFSKALMGISYTKPQEFYNLILNLVHDKLDASVGDAATAIEVENKRGDRWKLAGDKSLALSPDTLRVSQQAVAHANRNLELAARTTDTKDDEKWINDVWEYTPQPTGAGAIDMEATITQMLDIAGDTTINAFAAKTIENLDVGLAELVDDGTMRRKPGAGDQGPAPPQERWGPAPPTQEWGPARPGPRF